ncbi:MAG: 50S ribosomal protein L17 [Planctomycetota bacterium]|nr:50S ribosomal protein L17 [Planctomycetota bacterium]MDP6988260.1 50S ribosomal protein L17 [Planctomycetota bacterium]
MRHRVATSKLGRTASHRTAMRRNMMASLIEHERIITTVQKAKAVKPYMEKLVSLAGEASTHNRRRAFAALRNTDAVDKLFDVLGPRFKERPGGYCRVLKLSRRRLGDNGERAILEFVERTPSEEETLATESAASE